MHYVVRIFTYQDSEVDIYTSNVATDDNLIIFGINKIFFFSYTCYFHCLTEYEWNGNIQQDRMLNGDNEK